LKKAEHGALIAERSFTKKEDIEKYIIRRKYLFYD